MTIYSDCYRAIRGVRKFMTLIGLIPVNKSLQTLQILLICIIVAIVSCLRLWNVEKSVFQRESELSRIVNVVSLIMLWFVHIVILLETSYKTEQFENILLHFEKIQKSLLEQHCEYSSAAKLNLRALRFYAFLFLEVLELLFLAWILHTDGTTWLRCSIRIYSEISLKTKFFQFIVLVFETNSKQQDLLSVTKRVLIDIRATRYNRWPSRQHALNDLSIVASIRNEIWMVVKMIEDLCEWSLVCVFLKKYCDITFTAYWAYVSLDSASETTTYGILCLIFLIVRGLILLACCWICTSCEMLESDFITKLHLEGHKRSDTHLKLIIRDLSLQLLHKRIQFSAGDIIAINFRSLGEMIFSAIAYIVILIQFRMASPDK